MQRGFPEDFDVNETGHMGMNFIRLLSTGLEGHHEWHSDPLGIRPLCLGRLPDGGAIITSETCALDTVGAEFVREIEPGEAVLLGHGEPAEEQLMPSPRNLCANPAASSPTSQ